MKFLKFLLTASLGALYGLLFAQRPGKELRKKLKETKSPYKALFDECKDMDKEALELLITWAKESEDIKKAIKISKSQIKSFTKKAETLGKEGKKEAQKQLEELTEKATKAVKSIKKDVSKKSKTIKKTVKKIAKK